MARVHCDCSPQKYAYPSSAIMGTECRSGHFGQLFPFFSVSAAIGRLCLGLASAQSSRYTNYLALSLFGAYLNLLSLRAPKLRRVLLGVAILASVTTLPIRTADRGLMRFFSEIKRNWRSCYLAGGSISACDSAAGYKIEPEAEHVLQQKLDYLKGSRQNLYSGSN
jgi:hypothetical protein